LLTINKENNMGLPLIDSASGVFATGTVPGSDTLSAALTGSTNTVANDISNELGSEVAFNLVDRLNTAVTAYNAGHDTNLAKITSSVSSSVSGDVMTRTYVLSFQVGVDGSVLNVVTE
jgi:hypothetical protein